ncbi:MAG: hypothetical protein BGP08_15550 [Rhizobiales bacterium 64-17]|nr:MAG: hypothetical protein BGP08_15550 [Rhizobiales bacterium 64-17]
MDNVVNQRVFFCVGNIGICREIILRVKEAIRLPPFKSAVAHKMDEGILSGVTDVWVICKIIFCVEEWMGVIHDVSNA